MYLRGEPGGKVTVGIRRFPTLFSSSAEECVGSIALIKPFLAVLCHGVVKLGRKASIPAKLDNCRLPVWWYELLTSVCWAGQWGEKTSPFLCGLLFLCCMVSSDLRGSVVYI